MSQRVKQPAPPRTYHAPRRTAAAAETRQAILRAAKEDFEARGWAATTIRSIATAADVSPKTVEALFATKAALLEATLLAVMVGDANADTGDVVRPEGLIELQPVATRALEGAPDAATMLEIQSALVSEINVRSARIYWAFETAVSSDERLAEIWARMTEALLFAIRWTAEVLLQKPGVRAGVTLREAEETILAASDWTTYRTLTTKGGMTPEEFEAWMKRYYRRMLLA